MATIAETAAQSAQAGPRRTPAAGRANAVHRPPSSGSARRRRRGSLLCLLLLASCTARVAPAGVGSGGEATPLPAGIRRLTQAEAQASVETLLGISAASFAAALGTDTRQTGFTRNADQRVGSVQADALWHAAEGLAGSAVTQRLAQLAPCATSGGSDDCAKAFIHDFAAKAFRRTVAASEEAALFAVYTVGRTQDGTYAAGIQLVITAVLQAPSFLYLTELGDAVVDGRTALTGEEAASQLAYLLTGAPAGADLMTRGRSGGLATADGREAAARALLGTAEGKRQVERFVLEWLGADAVDSSSKDGVLYPEWPAMRADVLAESRWIIDSVLFGGDGTLRSLLLADRTSLTPALAAYYADMPGAGQVALPAARRGLLLSGAFLAANSQPASTAPVKRGATVRKKLLCQVLPVPTNLGVISVPPPDPTKTTRERFAVHSAAPACSGCHAHLDPPGFALESFDPVGRYRPTENGKPVDPSGELIDAGDATGPFANGVELVARLADATIVKDCLPRQVFRFAASRSGGGEEETFYAFVRGRPSAIDAKIVELLVDWVRSDSFMTRRAQ